MPQMYWNPDWTEDNGQPQWLPYGPTNPNYVAPNQANMVRPAPGAQPHEMPHTGMTPIMGDPVNGRVPSNGGIPYNAGIPPNAHVPTNAGVPFNTVRTRNIGHQPNTGFPMNTGAPMNTAVPSNPGMPNNTGAPQGSINGPNMSGVPVNTRVSADNQRQQIQGQPFVRQAAAPSRTRAPIGHHDGRYASGGPAPMPMDDEAQIEADTAEVKALRSSTRRTGSALIKSFEHQKRLERAERWMRRRGGPDRSGDMPQNAGQRVLVDRLCAAITNLQDIESRETRVNQSRRGDSKTIDSAAVKCVKEKSGYDVANLAWKFMASVRDSQSGNLELDRRFKFTEYKTFMGRFRDLEACLRVNKHLVRSAFESNEWVDRIAADPEGERQRKKENEGINEAKCKVLAEARRKKQADSSADGSEKKSKRPAKRRKHDLTPEPESEAEEDQPRPQLDHPQGPQQQRGQSADQPQAIFAGQAEAQAQEFQQQQGHQQNQQPRGQPQMVQQPQMAQQPQQQFPNHPQYINPQQGFVNHPQYGHPQQHGNAQQQFGNHVQHANPRQHAQPERRSNRQQSERPQQYVNPQQHGNHAQQFGNTQQTVDVQWFEQTQQHDDTNARQHGSSQQHEIPQQLSHTQQLNHTQQVDDAAQQFDNAQQPGTPQKQGQQPTAALEAEAAATPATDGQQSP